MFLDFERLLFSDLEVVAKMVKMVDILFSFYILILVDSNFDQRISTVVLADLPLGPFILLVLVAKCEAEAYRFR